MSIQRQILLMRETVKGMGKRVASNTLRVIITLLFLRPFSLSPIVQSLLNLLFKAQVCGPVVNSSF